MAKAISPTSGQPYGIQRDCEVWGSTSALGSGRLPILDVMAGLSR